MVESYKKNPWRLCVAPMMAWTDRHCRYFHRLLAPNARLYTEMLTAEAVVRGDTARLLAFNPAEHPVALQLGGCEPELLARAARLGENAGFDEINLNAGCPSERVQNGRFGACLMREPERVRDCIAAMRDVVSVPVTVKTRIGVDNAGGYDFLAGFVDTVKAGGCTTFIVHARKAWLQGLSPKQNRSVPPLEYEQVYRLRDDFPHLTLVINGGVNRASEIPEHLRHCDGVMLGRTAYQDPWELAVVDALLFDHPLPKRGEVVREMTRYAAFHVEGDGRLAQVTRHLLGLFQGRPGARRWRRALSENVHRKEATPELLLDALAFVGAP